MTVVFDNTFLTLLLKPDARARPNPATGQDTTNLDLRLDALIDELAKVGEKILIPSPAFAEALTICSDLEKVKSVVAGVDIMEIVPFDARAAVEYGIMVRNALANGDKRAGATGEWQRIKFDRQIVAVAVAHGASVLYTDDCNQTRFAELAGLTVRHTWDLPLPPKYAQTCMFDDQGTR